MSSIEPTPAQATLPQGVDLSDTQCIRASGSPSITPDGRGADVQPPDGVASVPRLSITSQRSQVPVLDDVDAMAAKAERAITRATGQAPGPQSRARLARNLETLANAGVRSPDAFKAWTDACRSRDYRACFAVGSLAETGFFVGMVAVTHLLSKGLGARLGSEFMARRSKVGLIPAGIVGGAEITAHALADGLAQRLHRSAPSRTMPRDVPRRDAVRAVAIDTARAAAINVSKNLPRVVLPYVQQAIERKFFGQRTDGLVDEYASFMLDAIWDGAAGLPAGVLNALLGMERGGDDIPHISRLLLAPHAHFEGIVARSIGAVPDPASPAEDVAPEGVPRGRLAAAFPKVMVALTVLGILCVHLSTLLSRNAQIGQSESLGRDFPAGSIAPDVRSLQALSSTHQMLVMSIFINLLGPVVEEASARFVAGRYSLPRPGVPAFLWPRPMLPDGEEA